MIEKSRTSARLRNAARERMNRTGESYTAALAAVRDGAPFMRPPRAASIIQFSYDSDDIPGEDPRVLNGIHIAKSLPYFWTNTIYDEPHVTLAPGEIVEEDDERFKRVDSGAWLALTPTVVCSIEAIYETGWKLELRHRESEEIIRSKTYSKWEFPLADAYGPSLMALFECFQFLTEVVNGQHSLWSTPDAGARALFPPTTDVRYWSREPYMKLDLDDAMGHLELTRSLVVAMWVNLADRWSHYLLNWPTDDQWPVISAYLASELKHPSRKRFRRLYLYHQQA